MKAYEIPVRVTREGSIEPLDALEEQAAWSHLTAEQFLAGYSEADSIYEREREKKMIRQLEQQFEPEKVQRIRELERLFQSLPLQRGAARYFISEIARCLDAGLILAALEVATSLLGLFVRDLLIVARFEDNIAQRSPRSHQLLDQVEREIEDVERLYFHGMVDELVDRRIIDQPDVDAIRDLYRTVRIPIHHGLTRRFVRLSSDIHEDDPLALLFLGRPGRFHRFEEAIEEDSIRHLSTIVNFIGRYSEGAN